MWAHVQPRAVAIERKVVKSSASHSSPMLAAARWPPPVKTVLVGQLRTSRGAASALDPCRLVHE
eukprot:5919508-Prymnesium_polylepis.1